MNGEEIKYKPEKHEELKFEKEVGGMSPQQQVEEKVKEKLLYCCCENTC